MYVQIEWQSTMLDKEKTETKRQQRLKKTSDSLYIKLAGRKTAIMAITAELEHVKALFNFLYLWPSHKVFACDTCISKNNYHV